MARAKVCSVCPHRFLMVKGIDSTRSVETSRCYECGTPLIRPLTMSLSAWFPFPPENHLYLHTYTFPEVFPELGNPRGLEV